MIIVADFESTGTNVFEAEIITGFFCLLDAGLNLVDTFEVKCNPYKWSDEAEMIHGISKRQASRYKKFSEVYPNIVNFIRQAGVTEFWCHSNSKMFGKITPYDYALLRIQMLDAGFWHRDGHEGYWLVNKLKAYSTHSLAKVLQGRFTFDGLSLDNVCRSLGIKLHHHDARSDCLATVEIMKRLLPLTTREELLNYERGINNEDTSTAIKRSSKKSRKKE